MTEQSMIERVARAVNCAMGFDADGWADALPIATAAIAAMREPLPSMIDAASNTPGMKAVDALVLNHFARTGHDSLKASHGEGSPLHQAWCAAIDAALKE